ncbi:MAG: response regulator [Lachnospiraceae bacterium]|nr:response regulator [Lachnospiraceae bacterium]
MKKESEFYLSSHRMVLFCYTLFTVILGLETVLMGWEKWALLLMAAGLALSWMLHIQQRLAPYSRMWIYSILMMAAFFFYGVHDTSTFDLSTVMTVIIMIYTITGIRSLITLCQITFYLTFGYEVMIMLFSGTQFDSLGVTRALLHLLMVTMASWIARNIIERWSKVLDKSRDEIEELKEATERLDNFLANVSHEIRTPVNAVMGLSSVLEKEELPENVKESVNSIFGAGQRVSEQIGDILDFTEIDMDKLSVTNENYMISSLVNDLLVQMSSAEDYGLDLVVDMEADIPSELVGDSIKLKKILRNLITNGYKYSKEGGVYVHLYTLKREYGVNLIIEVKDTGVGMTEDEIEHIFEKFYQSDSGRTRSAGGLGLGIPIVNGFAKAMGGVLTIESRPGEGTTVRVSIPQTVDDPSPCLSVKDKEETIAAGFLGFMTTGSPKIREYYMDMVSHLVSGLSVDFYRVQSRQDLENLVSSVKVSHLFVGTGEYLNNIDYIDSLTEKMNVAVVVDRGFRGELGGKVTLLPKPFYGAQVANFLNHTFGSANEVIDERMICPGLKALVVDDEPMNISVARGIFESYGMTVKSASGGMESIEAFEKENFDIIFMDHMMPGMDGVEAMKRLRLVASRKKVDVCIVALTANAISSAKEMFLSEGFDGFVPKPIDITDLERVLKHVLPKSAIVYIKNDKKKTLPDARLVGSAVEDRYKALKDYGVDVAQGLKYSQNDEDFYLKLLGEYASDRDRKKNDLEKYYLEGNMKEYAIRVHAIKSTSKMIGANSVSDTAKLLENASKKSDREKVDELHGDFLSAYCSLMDIIKELKGVNVPEQIAAARDDEDPVPENSGGDDDIMEFAPAPESDGEEGKI